MKLNSTSTYVEKTYFKNYVEIINHFIEKKNFTTYLEIGVGKPEKCFSLVDCKYKNSIDPFFDSTFKVTSNDYFDKYCKYDRIKKYDIIYIDSVYERFQFVRDVKNSLKILCENGIIICRKCMPINQIYTNSSLCNIANVDNYFGTQYLGWLDLRREEEDIKMGVLPLHTGIGVIKKGKQECFTMELTSFPEYLATYYHSLPILTIKEFLEF